MNENTSSVQSTRRGFVGTVAGFSLLSMIGDASAQPKVSVLKILCAFAPGGPTDLLSRKVAAAIPSSYAGTVVVDNRPGSAGQVAVGVAKQLPTDGSNILQTAMSAFTLSPYVQASLPYDPMADFVPLTVATAVDYAYVVGPMVPQSVRTVADYMAWVRRDPKHATVATAGIVSLIIGAILGKVAGVELVNVSYKGGILAVQDTLAGISPAVITSVADVLPHLGENKLRILAVTNDKRNAAVPNVPTFAEQGVADMVHKVYFSFFAQAKTPQDVLASQSAALRAALRQKDVTDALTRANMEVLPLDMKESADLLASDRAKWAALTARINYKPT